MAGLKRRNSENNAKLWILDKSDSCLLARLAWILCVTSSCIAAAVLIFGNISNWANQPSVVTSVEFKRVQTHPEWMPKVHMCQRSANTLLMLLQTFNEENVDKSLLDGLDRSLGTLAIYAETVRRKSDLQSGLDINRDQNQNKTIRFTYPYAECFKVGLKESYIFDTSIQESDCLLLYLMDELRTGFGFEKAEDILTDFVRENNGIPGRLTERQLKDHIEMKYSVKLPKTNMTSINGEEELVRGRQILSLYLIFFPIYTIVNPEEVKNKYVYDDMELQTLKSYRISESYKSAITLPQVQGNNDLVTKLAKSINSMGPLIQKITNFAKAYKNNDMASSMIGMDNYKHLIEFNNLFANIWLENARMYLEVDTYQDVIILLKAFDYSRVPIFKLKSYTKMFMNNYEYDPCNVETNMTNVIDICDSKNDRADTDKECVNYCHAVKKLLSNVQKMAKVKTFLEMGFHELGSPFGAFQDCGQSRNVGSCWKKVVTDKGICFSTSLASMEYDNWRVPSTEFPNLFILRGDGRFDIGGVVEKYDSAQLSPYEGRFFDFYIVPPYQTAVDSILLDNKQLNINGIHQASLGPYGQDRMNEVNVEVDTVMTSTSEFRRMNINKRDCLHQGERKLHWVETDSEADCFLECTWKIAVNRCGCAPFYLADIITDKPLCELYGNKCFTRMVENRYWDGSETMLKCHPKCPLDCERITYKSLIYRYDTVRENFDYVEHYLERTKGNSSLDRSLERISKSLKQVYYTNKDEYNNAFLIRMFVTGKLAHEVKRTATMTTVDLISNVGGTLGLFCGFSIISLAEVVQRIIDFAWNQLGRGKKYNKR